MIEEIDYSTWLECNNERLKVEYETELAEKYTEHMPDTYFSFDDYCMAQWQWR